MKGLFEHSPSLRKWAIVISLILLTPVIAAGTLYSTMLWQHNQPPPPVTTMALDQTYNDAVVWAQQNQQPRLETDNAVLWSFINDASKIRQNPRLNSLLEKYTARQQLRKTWQYNFFMPTRRLHILYEDMHALPAYNKHFIYALSCNNALAETDIIQRLMMLASTGSPEQLKTIWIQRFLAAQLEDGAWESFHPLLSIGDYRIGFGYHYPEVRRQRKINSEFHATAQAIYLTSLILANRHQNIPP